MSLNKWDIPGCGCQATNCFITIQINSCFCLGVVTVAIPELGISVDVQGNDNGFGFVVIDFGQTGTYTVTITGAKWYADYSASVFMQCFSFNFLIAYLTPKPGSEIHATITYQDDTSEDVTLIAGAYFGWNFWAAPILDGYRYLRLCSTNTPGVDVSMDIYTNCSADTLLFGCSPFNMECQFPVFPDGLCSLVSKASVVLSE